MTRSTDPAGATAGQGNRSTGAYPASHDEPTARPRGGQGAYHDVTAGESQRPAAALDAANLKRGGLAPKGVRTPDKVTVLEPAGREEQLRRHGLSTSHRWSEAERRPRFSDELDASDYDADAVEGRELEELGFVLEGGWTAVETARGSRGWTPGARDAGMTSHRGVLHPHEHVDAEALRPAVEAELGFSYDDVHAVYRQGRKSLAQLELRERIDARLLELAASGGVLAELGRALGFPIKDDGHCRVIENALARARKERA